MRLGKYIKDRLYSVCIFVAMLIISVLMMAAFKVSVQLIIAEIFIMIICYIAVVLADYYHRKKFYDELEANIAALEEKYLITETLVRPAFYEGQIFYDSVSDIDRSMTENVKRYRQGMEQFKEYVEMWIHEIKLPIASLYIAAVQHRRIRHRRTQKIHRCRTAQFVKIHVRTGHGRHFAFYVSLQPLRSRELFLCKECTAFLAEL